jgi:hypothetical protein
VNVKRHAPAALCRRTSSLYSSNTMLDGTQIWSGGFEGEKISCSCPEIEPRFLGHLILSLGTIPTEVSRLTKFDCGNDSRLSSDYGNDSRLSSHYGNDSRLISDYGNDRRLSSDYGNDSRPSSHFGNDSRLSSDYGNDSRLSIDYGNDSS